MFYFGFGLPNTARGHKRCCYRRKRRSLEQVEIEAGWEDSRGRRTSNRKRLVKLMERAMLQVATERGFAILKGRNHKIVVPFYSQKLVICHSLVYQISILILQSRFQLKTASLSLLTTTPKSCDFVLQSTEMLACSRAVR
jgi:hypothetical protein